MTIVAGFKCSDGIVLAADTLISHWQSNSYESKIFQIGERTLQTCFVAYSGDVLATKEIKGDLEKVFLETEDETQIIPALKKKLKEIHRDQFTNAP